MTAFEFTTPAGDQQRQILRRSLYEREMGQELRLLESLRNAGLPVPKPYGLQGDSLVLEYIEGAVEANPADAEAFLDRYADQLVRIHNVDLEPFDFLPRQERNYPKPWKGPDEELRETEIRTAIAGYPPRTNPSVLRHGDLWPGNILWRDSKVAAIIDWEEALIGDPVADLAICRLDLWWVLGESAAEGITRRYLERRPINLNDLPYWDLCASLRPMSNLHEWASSYPSLGRPDITEATMSRDHRAFVAQALAAL